MFARLTPRRAGLVSIVALLAVGPASAQKDIDFFENRIRPVLVERCAKCHSAERKQSKGGLKLDSREHILKGGDSGAAVIPGDPERSLLIRAIRRTDKEHQMPPGKDDHLTPAQIQDFAAWVK